MLKNINLSIVKGERIGFMGVTGSGKSTLLDIIMGLLPPTDGKLTIDQKPLNSQNRRAWQVHIAHVPQSIYLTDSTIEENIAFGIRKEKIDHQRVIKVAKQAQIADMIEDLKDGYQTLVGERGVRLSGGQRQRINIARALYRKADVLIFDEATSALDSKIEKNLMDELLKLKNKYTIICISHRTSTIRDFDKIFKIENNYLNLIDKSNL